jgi:hypothetical protein
MCWKSVPIWPGTVSPASAAFTAPQLVWPRTLITSTQHDRTVFEAGDLDRGGYVAGDADDEEIANLWS